MAPQIRGELPLRVALVAATLLLVACGLTASGIAVTSILRQHLIQRADQTLEEASRGWAQAPKGALKVPHGANLDRPPSNFYVRSMPSDGRGQIVINDRHAEPVLPANNDVGPEPTTVGSVDKSGVQWRVVSVRGPNRLVTVAYDLSEIQHTVRSLAWLQLGIGVAVLLVLGLVGSWVVTQSLRPMTEVEQTAAASAAGHELRTPWTTMRGFAELYRQGAARDMEMVMSRIESESRRMGLLIDDLLLLARLDAQRPIERKLVDLLALATDAVHDARAVSPNRTITLEVVDGPGTPEVLGDEARLRQVLGNLMTNALQHTPETADIIVRGGTNAEDAILEVVDEGPGMSWEDAQRVFERFYRTDSSRARSSGGSGLGLSIVDSLVHAHGGA